MFKKITFFILFVVRVFANDFTLQEQCSYENKQFWIKILYLCAEGDVSCDRMMYIGVNKVNGDYIVLKGKTLLDENLNFKGYSFKSGIYEYTIFKNNLLYLSKNGKTLKEISLEKCN